MGASRTDPCGAFRDRILDLANGEIEPAREPALAVHLEMCEPCRRRLAFDRADRARRDRSYASAGSAFPAGRSEAFWTELSERVARRPAPMALAFRAAASFLFAAGLAAGLWAGPRLAHRLRGVSEPPSSASAEAPRGTKTFRAGPSVSGAPLRSAAGLQHALPPIRLVSSQEGGF